MPFKNREDRLKYILKYNKTYYKRKHAEILAQKKMYYAKNKDQLVAKMAASRKGKELQAAANTRAWYSKNTNRAKETATLIRLRNTYGLTPEKFAALVDNQKGLCAICGLRPRKLCVDHCHNTLKVRGLLCRKCNSGIGLLRDSPQLLKRALEYLTEKEPHV